MPTLAFQPLASPPSCGQDKSARTERCLLPDGTLSEPIDNPHTADRFARRGYVVVIQVHPAHVWVFIYSSILFYFYVVVTQVHSAKGRHFSYILPRWLTAHVLGVSLLKFLCSAGCLRASRGGALARASRGRALGIGVSGT
jgi:hypothetical protein